MESNTENQTPNPTQSPGVSKAIEFLSSLGITIANEATEDEVCEAIKSLADKARSVDSLAAECASMANEVAEIRNQTEFAQDHLARLRFQHESDRAAFANERQMHIGNIIGIALVTGKITAFEKPMLEMRLSSEANFANEAAALIALQPKLKTSSATLNIKTNPVSIANAQERRNILDNLVQAEMAANGGDYSKAWQTIQRRHPGIFELMKKPSK